MRTVVIVDQRTGVEVASFDDYATAAVYRLDVLMPGFGLGEVCPFVIRGVPR